MDSLNQDSLTGKEQITVLFFATLKERAGTRQAVLDLPPGTRVGDLKTRLGQKYPGLAQMTGSMLVSVNKEFAFDEEEIPAGAEVAIFPPVSGGSIDGPPTIFAITEDELDLDDLLRRITLPSTGAACIFTGMVRGVTGRGDPHETVYLEYEAYLPMAEAKMRQVAEEIRRRWDSVEGIAIVQRIGKLYPMTPTVLIACTAAHRDTGVFEAARYGIDRLKEIVPVWKKEIGPQGEEWVEGEYLPGRND
jgi:molybdopterin synthase catalytic subunit